MSIDFESEIKSEFRSNLTWTRIVCIIYGILCLIGSVLHFFDPVVGLPPEWARFVSVFAVALIICGLLLPKSPAIIGSLILTCLISLQIYGFILTGKVSIFLLVVIFIGIWDVRSYMSYNRYAKKHLDSPSDED